MNVLSAFIFTVPIICLCFRRKDIFTESFELNILKGHLKINNKEKSLDDSAKPPRLKK